MVKTRLTEHTGVEFPIICGAMYPCSNPELLAAASEGGGIAIIQPVSLTMVHGYDKPDTKEGLRVAIQHIRTMREHISTLPYKPYKTIPSALKISLPT